MSFSELSAKGGKKLILDLPSDERVTFCISKIETKQEEIDQVKGVEGLQEREKELERQILNYGTILKNLQNEDCDDVLLSAIIVSMETQRTKKLVALDDQVKGNGLKEEEIQLPKQTPKLWGQNLINEAAKFLMEVRDDKLKNIILKNLKYKDLKDQLDNLLAHQEALQLDNDGVLPPFNPYAKQLADLENVEKEYIKKVDKVFADKEKITILTDKYRLTEVQAIILLQVIMAEKSDTDADVIKALYNH